MADKKPFRNRIKEEVRDFATIYKSHRAAYESRLKADDGSGKHKDREVDPWAYAFGLSFENSVKAHPAKQPKKKKPNRPSSNNDAVVETIRELGLDQLRLGAIVSEDARVSTALEIGLLTEDDLAPLYNLAEEEQRSLGFEPITRTKLDSSDPFFWRTLLDIFCRAFIASGGRPAWPLTRMIDLAFDLDEIMTMSLTDRKWNEEAALKVLREKKPYKSKYPSQSNLDGLATGTCLLHRG